MDVVDNGRFVFEMVQPMPGKGVRFGIDRNSFTGAGQEVYIREGLSIRITDKERFL